MKTIYVMTYKDYPPIFVKADDEGGAIKEYLAWYPRGMHGEMMKDPTLKCRVLTLELLDSLTPDEFKIEAL